MSWLVRMEVFPGPSGEALDALVGFAIDGSLGDLLAVARPRPEGCQAELPLEGPGPGEQLLVVPSRRMNPKRLGVNLVDGNVDVLVIGIAVTQADVYERVDQLEVQSAVTNRELEQPADAVEVGVDPRDLSECLSVDRAL
ncbi:MAG: hypothetical protein AMS21_02705 [Gemmatimonas sp. SG8_38_2]|nr:MAG: hypothetical protein AMS21_02705 [Gemmatimonas sp. SG8_38_2]